MMVIATSDGDDYVKIVAYPNAPDEHYGFSFRMPIISAMKLVLELETIIREKVGV